MIGKIVVCTIRLSGEIRDYIKTWTNICAGFILEIFDEALFLNRVHF